MTEYLGYTLPDAPKGWVEAYSLEDGTCYDSMLRHERVIISITDVYSDGKRWLHFSHSFKNRIPKWHEFVAAKELFIPQHIGLQVLPPRDQWVNINPNVLHLFVSLDGDVTPDFAPGGSI